MFGGTWGASNNNNNNQQQQQQQPSVFGQPSNAFGGGFGSTQQQGNPQQPPSIFGAPSTSSSGFGGFGSASTSTANPNPLMSGFGSQNQAARSTFGGFGSTNNAPAPTFGGNSFGGGAAQNAFGAPSTFGSTPAAGTSSGFGAFGAPKQVGGFGQPADSSAPNTGGTPYSVTSERDNTTANGTQTSVYQSISCMPAYRNWSPEELRFGDYQQNRKTASGSSQSGFGTASAFGSTSNLFGQPQQPSTTTGPFGASSNTPATSGTTGFGAFGSSNATQPSTFGAFGQTANTQNQQSGGFGTFGQPQPGASSSTGNTFGGFGSAQQPQPAGAFGAFGSTNQDTNKPAFGAFGATNNTTSSTGFGGFSGQNNPPSTGIFGQPPQQQQSAFGGFGQPNKPSLFGGSNAFGQPQPQQQTSAFGTQNPFGSAPGTTTATNIFGQPQDQQQQQAQQAQQPNSLFGQPQTNSAFGQPSTGSTNIFGNQQATQPQQTSLFGNPNPSTTGSSIFGTAPKPTTTFGSTQGGIFGAPATQTQQPAALMPGNASTTGTGIFGAPPTQTTNPPGLFGGAVNTTNNLFGAAKPATSLFGAPTTAPQFNSTMAPATSLFGGGSGFGSVFGNNTTTAQPSLTASIDQPISLSLPAQQLLTSTTLPPLALSFSQPTGPKKPSNYYPDIPSKNIQPRIGLNQSAGFGKLRGFGASSTLTNSNQNIYVSSLGKSVNPFTVPLPPSPASTPGSTKGTDSPLSSSVSLGSLGSSLALGNRASPKKLILSKKAVPDGQLGQKGNGIKFDPALNVAARVRDNLKSVPAETYTSTVASKTQVSAKPKSDKDAQEGDYWSKPSVEELVQMDYTQLSHVEDFTVGRIGYGEIKFLQPVDLTTVGAVRDIPGGIVVFLEREAIVYPDDLNKPPPGEGLNVPAEVRLDKVWAVDKSNREPIKDENHIQHRRLLKKLMGYPNTKFLGFEMLRGQWRFQVEGF